MELHGYGSPMNLVSSLLPPPTNERSGMPLECAKLGESICKNILPSLFTCEGSYLNKIQQGITCRNFSKWGH